MQIITIVENNHVTGVVYGTVEVVTEKDIAKKQYNKIQQKRAQIRTLAFKRTKHK